MLLATLQPASCDARTCTRTHTKATLGVSTPQHTINKLCSAAQPSDERALQNPPTADKRQPQLIRKAKAEATQLHEEARRAFMQGVFRSARDVVVRNAPHCKTSLNDKRRQGKRRRRGLFRSYHRDCPSPLTIWETSHQPHRLQRPEQ